MFASLAALALALAAQPARLPPPGPGSPPLPLFVSDGDNVANACVGREGWTDPAPPANIHGDTFYVGTCGISAILIRTSDGLVLIDGGPAAAAPLILASIRARGSDPRQIRFILSSHEHFDHVGGLAALKQATGAQVVALRAARAVLTSGRPDRADPQRASLRPFAGVAVDRLVRDGESITVGGTVITAHATPGHTGGSTSWSWRSCTDPARCPTIVYADSLTAPAADGYRFTDHPGLIATWRATFAKVAALDCDLLITPHPSASNLFARMAGRAPLVDPAGCRTYADAARVRFEQRLAQERTAR